MFRSNIRPFVAHRAQRTYSVKITPKCTETVRFGQPLTSSHIKRSYYTLYIITLQATFAEFTFFVQIFHNLLTLQTAKSEKPAALHSDYTVFLSFLFPVRVIICLIFRSFAPFFAFLRASLRLPSPSGSLLQPPPAPLKVRIRREKGSAKSAKKPPE